MECLNYLIYDLLWHEQTEIQIKAKIELFLMAIVIS